MGKNEKVEKAEKTSKKKLAIIVVAIVFGLVLAGGAGGALVWFLMKDNVPEMQDWTKTYFNHIKKAREDDTTKESETSSEEENKNEDFWRRDDANTKVGFYETKKSEAPMMVVNYNTVQNNVQYNMMAIYAIRNEEVVLINYQEFNQLVYMLNVESNTYNFYLKGEGEDKDTYLNVDEYLVGGMGNPVDYEVECSTDKEAENYCEDVFVEEEIEVPSFDYNPEMKESELGKEIASTADKSVSDEMVQEELREDFEESAKAAKKRIAEKEEAKKYFTLAGKKLKFGRYKAYDDWGQSWPDLIFNPDYTMSDSNGKKTGTFEIKVLTKDDVPCRSYPPTPDCADKREYSGKEAIVVHPSDSEYDRLYFLAEVFGFSSEYDIAPYGQVGAPYKYVGE